MEACAVVELVQHHLVQSLLRELKREVYGVILNLFQVQTFIIFLFVSSLVQFFLVVEIIHLLCLEYFPKTIPSHISIISCFVIVRQQSFTMVIREAIFKIILEF